MSRSQPSSLQSAYPVHSGGTLWVFGYGSLMWRPGFPHAECHPALLRGFHRAMCVYSHRYRGTPEVPGLVLGLDRGGSCRGRVFRVAAEDAVETIAYLHRREMVTGVYQPRFMTATLDDGRRVRAYSFVVDRGHAQYAGKLTDEAAARVIRRGRGLTGTAEEYLANTVAHLDDLGIREGALHRLLTVVRRG